MNTPTRSPNPHPSAADDANAALARDPAARGRAHRGRTLLLALLLATTAATLRAAPPSTDGMVVERDLVVPMRDGVRLRADLFRPAGDGRFPVLVYRTPYDRKEDEADYTTHLRAVERGYAVLVQDVRGRYGSEGEFDPYRNEGRDGFDTIEWAATQPWSSGAVGTYGLSYPGAVQWLAAMERPPHLRAMVPAMTFSSPRRFFYFDGVFDLSWLSWLAVNIAPQERVRRHLDGPLTSDAAGEQWQQDYQRWLAYLPLRDLPDLKQVTPYYYEWLAHPPDDDWWDWAELRGRYDRVQAAVLNLSGWHDEAYGPEGATTNFQGLVASRGGRPEHTRLILGPWTHGVRSLSKTRIGDLEFGPAAAIDYDSTVLDFLDRELRGIEPAKPPAPVSYFVMGANRWREADTWPPSTRSLDLYFKGSGEYSQGVLAREPPQDFPKRTFFTSDPASPVTDPYGTFGPHDFHGMSSRADLVFFDSQPFEQDTEVTGPIVADLYVTCDCPDFDLWVKILDLDPRGGAWSLMSPGLDVLRASYREPGAGRQVLEPGTIYHLRLDRMMTSNLFQRGHRLRVQVSGSFLPFLSRNPQTGELETYSARHRKAQISIYHTAEQPSRLILPIAEP